MILIFLEGETKSLSSNLWSSAASGAGIVVKDTDLWNFSTLKLLGNMTETIA